MAVTAVLDGVPCRAGEFRVGDQELVEFGGVVFDGFLLVVLVLMLVRR